MSLTRLGGQNFAALKARFQANPDTQPLLPKDGKKKPVGRFSDQSGGANTTNLPRPPIAIVGSHGQFSRTESDSPPVSPAMPHHLRGIDGSTSSSDPTFSDTSDSSHASDTSDVRRNSQAGKKWVSQFSAAVRDAMNGAESVSDPGFDALAATVQTLRRKPKSAPKEEIPSQAAEPSSPMTIKDRIARLQATKKSGSNQAMQPVFDQAKGIVQYSNQAHALRDGYAHLVQPHGAAYHAYASAFAACNPDADVHISYAVPVLDGTDTFFLPDIAIKRDGRLVMGVSISLSHFPQGSQIAELRQTFFDSFLRSEEVFNGWEFMVSQGRDGSNLLEDSQRRDAQLKAAGEAYHAALNTVSIDTPEVRFLKAEADYYFGRGANPGYLTYAVEYRKLFHDLTTMTTHQVLKPYFAAAETEASPQKMIELKYQPFSEVMHGASRIIHAQCEANGIIRCAQLVRFDALLGRYDRALADNTGVSELFDQLKDSLHGFKGDLALQDFPVFLKSLETFIQTIEDQFSLDSKPGSVTEFFIAVADFIRSPQSPDRRVPSQGSPFLPVFSRMESRLSKFSDEHDRSTQFDLFIEDEKDNPSSPIADHLNVFMVTSAQKATIISSLGERKHNHHFEAVFTAPPPPPPPSVIPTITIVEDSDEPPVAAAIPLAAAVIPPVAPPGPAAPAAGHGPILPLPPPEAPDEPPAVAAIPPVAPPGPAAPAAGHGPILPLPPPAAAAIPPVAPPAPPLPPAPAISPPVSPIKPVLQPPVFQYGEGGLVPLLLKYARLFMAVGLSSRSGSAFTSMTGYVSYLFSSSSQSVANEKKPEAFLKQLKEQALGSDPVTAGKVTPKAPAKPAVPASPPAKPIVPPAAAADEGVAPGDEPDPEPEVPAGGSPGSESRSQSPITGANPEPRKGSLPPIPLSSISPEARSWPPVGASSVRAVSLVTPAGGIGNTGNTCYLNSALQILNRIFNELTPTPNAPPEDQAKVELLRTTIDKLRDQTLTERDLEALAEVFLEVGLHRQQDSTEVLTKFLALFQSPVELQTSMASLEEWGGEAIIRRAPAPTVFLPIDFLPDQTRFSDLVSNAVGILQVGQVVADVMFGDFPGNGFQTSHLKLVNPDSESSIVVFNLNRFKRNEGVYRKLSTPVVANEQFEMEVGGRRCQFTLVGGIIHAGTVDNGHYLSFAKDPVGPGYTIFNDGIVSQVGTLADVPGLDRGGYSFTYRITPLKGVIVEPHLPPLPPPPSALLDWPPTPRRVTFEDDHNLPLKSHAEEPVFPHEPVAHSSPVIVAQSKPRSLPASLATADSYSHFTEEKMGAVFAGLAEKTTTENKEVPSRYFPGTTGFYRYANVQAPKATMVKADGYPANFVDPGHNIIACE